MGFLAFEVVGVELVVPARIALSPPSDEAVAAVETHDQVVGEISRPTGIEQ